MLHGVDFIFNDTTWCRDRHFIAFFFADQSAGDWRGHRNFSVFHVSLILANDLVDDQLFVL